jgi:hypothetical protein
MGQKMLRNTQLAELFQRLGIHCLLICERHRFGLVFFLLSPHLYSIGMDTLIHYVPRHVLPSVSSFLIGLSYVLSRGDGKTAINRLFHADFSIQCKCFFRFIGDFPDLLIFKFSRVTTHRV